MPEFHKLASFVDSLHYREKTGPQIDPKKGCFPFIAISRQAGAGGNALAAVLDEKIQKLHAEPLFRGWQLCGHELCHMVAQDPKLKDLVESLKRTEYHSHAEDILSQLIYGGSSQDVAVKKMFHLMRAFALHGKVILVGRGSTFLTRDLPLGIHIRLEASMESRMKRMMPEFGPDEKNVRRVIDEKDKAKAELVKTFFNKDIRDPLLYDVVWNTDRVPIEEIAKLTIEMIRDKAAGTC
ncbi:MAG: cytidylate kinase family protein [Candidatus Omnitrophica bacterium]|nr:cytidylate kinase family protein [Candidatus Omnitrophota bacterium]